MRYFTKEWYELMQKQDYTLSMKKIPDRKYTDKDIKELYNRELKKWILNVRKEYDEPPIFFDIEAMIDDGELALEDVIILDEANNTCRKAKSIEEVLEHTKKEKEMAMDEFENRPPFDEKEVMRDFDNMYRVKQKYVNLPKWVLENVDKRLLALDMVPESVYNKLKCEEKENKKEFKRIEKVADKVLGKEVAKIPKDILEAFNFHDAAILSLKKEKKDMVMVLNAGGVPFDDTTTYRRVVFSDVEVIENEVRGSIRRSKERLSADDENEDWYWSNCYYLYDEIYVLNDGRYEVHMMMELKGLRYVTVRCSGITVENI